MFILIILFYLASGTLSSITPPISSLFTGANPYPPNDPSTLLLPFSRDEPTCTCPPNGRSLWNIIWSCLATLFLCSWVSVHPDVPAPDVPGYGEKWWRSWVRRMEYMVWTLMTPEMIICWASRQWVGARKIQQEQKARGWTVTHGHFMQMGGFMLFKGKERKGTLSYERFQKLLEQDRIEFPNITREEIEDKSKSDGLAKTLVVGQTGWFVLQCIARVAQRLPITELELATLAFAVLNGFMCFFWWNKPFGVQCPVPVYLIVPTQPEVGMPVPTTDYDASVASTSQTLLGDQNSRKANSPGFYNFDSFRRSILTWSGWAKYITWPWTFVLFIGHRLRAMNEDEGKIRAFDTGNKVEEDMPGPMRVPTFYSLLAVDDDLLYIGVPFVGCLYGAIHCAAWYFHFPTVAELWLWRVSSVIIAAVPFIVLFFVYLVMAFSLEDRHSIIYAFTVISVFLGLSMYVLARLVILGESLSTLRNLPPGALDDVEWTSFLPHI